MGDPLVADPSPEELRRQNDQVLQALSHWHDRAFGFVYVSPKHVEASLAEIDRCVRDGPMVGIKLWVARAVQRPGDRPDHPAGRRSCRPLVFQHTWFKAGGNLPGESSPLDLVELAARHPGVPLICGHTGGDWERGHPGGPGAPGHRDRPGRLRPDGRLRRDGRARAGGRADPLRQRRRRAELRLATGQGRSGRTSPRTAKRLILGENLRTPAGADPPRQGGRAAMIDVNVYLSRWPFRRLPHDEPEALVRKLRSQGVDAGLGRQLRRPAARGPRRRQRPPGRGRAASTAAGLLVPFGAVNPRLPDWREDLRRCHEEHGMPGIRLHPNYHGYRAGRPRLRRPAGRGRTPRD